MPNRILDMAGKRFSELEDRSTEITQSQNRPPLKKEQY